MDWVSHTISSFGQSVGIPDLELDNDGCALFTLEPSGALGLQDLQPTGGEEVLIMLTRPLPAPPAASVRRALTMADFRNNPMWDTQLALRGSDLVVTLRMPRHSFLMSALEEAVEALFNFHTRLEQSH
jgi:type III secretion system chaperone SycN